VIDTAASPRDAAVTPDADDVDGSGVAIAAPALRPHDAAVNGLRVTNLVVQTGCGVGGATPSFPSLPVVGLALMRLRRRRRPQATDL
jgi:hypothetical protein